MTSCISVQGGDADASSEWEGDGVRLYYATQRDVQFQAQGVCVCVCVQASVCRVCMCVNVCDTIH